MRGPTATMKYAVPIIICLAFLALAACSRTSPVPVSTQAPSPAATGWPTATIQSAITPTPGLQTVEYLERYSPDCGKPPPQSWPPGVTPHCPPTPRPTPRPTQPPLWDSFEEFLKAVPGYGGFSTNRIPNLEWSTSTCWTLRSRPKQSKQPNSSASLFQVSVIYDPSKANTVGATLKFG